jgi:hypothetical protein
MEKKVLFLCFFLGYQVPEGNGLPDIIRIGNKEENFHRTEYNRIKNTYSTKHFFIDSVVSVFVFKFRKALNFQKKKKNNELNYS